MTTQHTQGRLLAVEHYIDAVSITDQRGFEIIEVSRMPILLGYGEKLGISHWSDKPGEAFLELEPEDQAAIARHVVACWNACQGISIEYLETTAAIAACEPAPTIQHLPADDTEGGAA